MASTYGPAYSESLDGNRIRKQQDAIYTYMRDGRWHTLEEISSLGYPESSVSAQLRHFRKPRFGGHTILKRRRFSGHGLWEYQLHLAHKFIDDKCYCGARNPEPVQLKLLKWER
tara:strand:+ start:371 stop:712 length:342 start_codon:yes stop_codon:yes gene_type:complete